MNNKYGFIRIGCITPRLKLADIDFNTKSIINAVNFYAAKKPDILVFPELSITGYTCADLFSQELLYKKALSALIKIKEKTKDYNFVIAVGLPFLKDSNFYNCAAVLFMGQILGIVPKTYLPNFNEFYEQRWFSSGFGCYDESIYIDSEKIPFGTNLLFKPYKNSQYIMAVEICEDLWAPIPPSSKLAIAGADIIINLSASNELAGKSNYRKQLIETHSAQLLCVYAYCSAGMFESTTDTVFGGHRIIAENGRLLAEGERFETKENATFADADISFIKHERIQNKTYANYVNNKNLHFRFIAGNNDELLIENQTVLSKDNFFRFVDKHPFIPKTPTNRYHRCKEIFSIQSTALASRLTYIGCKNVILGLSGGLDSTLALLVCISAFKKISLDLSGIKCFTMPCFGTTKRTKNNALRLCKSFGIGIETITIDKAVKNHFKDIKHNENDYNITYENAQARERTQILMDKANQLGGIVIGTGDLSEQALGWSTYNGDHMSMYAVNTGVPKTLVRHLVDYYIKELADSKTAKILTDINNTPISPELLPPDSNGEILQKTEDNIGPYELHDFFLYQVVRCGFNPQKVIFLADVAFTGIYEKSTIKKWLKVFYKRFFSQQFKRSCVPGGPKIGTIALSPRADWRMPDDASANLWISELEKD